MRYIITLLALSVLCLWTYSTIKDIIVTKKYMREELKDIPEFLEHIDTFTFNRLKVSSSFLVIIAGLIIVTIIVDGLLFLSMNYW